MRIGLLFGITAVFLITGCDRAPETYSFALIGDGPYAPVDSLRYEALIDEINAAEDVKFVIHAGDIKAGSQPCTDDFLKGRLAILSRFEDPFILTPGDNEWTDCHPNSSHPFDPLDRLAKLRSLFYPEVGLTLGRQPMEVESQATLPAWSTYVENVRWTRSNVHYATIHMVGSSNGMAAFDGRSDVHDAAVEERTRAGIEWLRHAFDRARSDAARGLFITIHGNPGIDRREEPEPYRTFLAALREETSRFGKPVVLAHGDSHYFIIDKPLRHPETNKRLTNFTRVETFGASDVHWIEVMVDPEGRNVFSFDQRIVTLE